MFVIIIGGGKVGLNTARQLILLGHEIVLVEQRAARYAAISHVIDEEYLVFGDGTEIWVLERAGIGRADMLVAVTGDDEDNIIISQIAEQKFGVPKVVARVNNPFNQPTFDLLGIQNTVSATTGMLNLIMHELPTHKFVHLMSLRREKLELVELEIGKSSPFANSLVQDINLPEGVLLAAILRDGEALVARGSSEIMPGDYVLCLLPKDQETALLHEFLPDEEAERVREACEIEVPEDE